MEMFEDHQSPSTQAKDEESGRCEQNRQHPDWNEEEEGWMEEDSEEAILLASRVSGDGMRALVALISVLDRNVYAGDNTASVSLGKEDNRHPNERH
ncbi:hypothetical protein CPC08DRAFT_717608 [Agrocybe pediades]|nr:hypothetical protein CPC08DRAFT_717608 [Agrocybe pediades]